MNKTEALQILAILKAAYPNSYKGLSKEEALSTAMVWSIQFVDMPAEVVMMAVNKAISSSPFPPSVSEVKKKIGELYWEAEHAVRLWEQDASFAAKLNFKDDEERGEKWKAATRKPPPNIVRCERIKKLTRAYGYSKTFEPTLTDMLPIVEQMQLNGGDST